VALERNRGRNLTWFVYSGFKLQSFRSPFGVQFKVSVFRLKVEKRPPAKLPRSSRHDLGEWREGILTSQTTRAGDGWVSGQAENCRWL